MINWIKGILFLVFRAHLDNYEVVDFIVSGTVLTVSKTYIRLYLGFKDPSGTPEAKCHE